MYKRNIIANYVSQLYVTIIGILILPLYVKYMGPEAYGLVGFFSMLQAWFALLDLGLTPTIGRESARYFGGVLAPLAFRQLHRVLSVIFVFIAVVGSIALFLFAELIAKRWLNIADLAVADVVLALQIMSVCIGLRWMCGLYRGVITGAEKLVWLSGFNIFIATLRFIVVLPVMWLWGFTPVVFFIHQLVVAFLEMFGFVIKAEKLLPNKKSVDGKIGWSFQPVIPVLRFSLTIAFTSIVWVGVTQTDKLVLSGILTLTEYGYFTMAVLVAGGILVIGGPISSAIMPRMARLHAEGKHDELIAIYRQSTQLVAVIAGSAAITIAITADSLLFAWTGDVKIVEQAAPILQLYALGNGFLTLAAFPYYLQYARGNLRYHFIGNICVAVILIPGIVLAASHFGGVGAGYVWLTVNFLFLLVWVAYVHHKLEPGLHLKWLTYDVIKIIVPAAVVAVVLSIPEIQLTGRVSNLLFVIVVGIIVLGCGMFFSNYVRDIVKAKL